jgi:S1-C subfamily serine protease
MPSWLVQERNEMNKRWLWILLGVIVLGMVLLAGAAAGAGITYFAFRAVPVEAAQINFLETITLENNDDERGVLVIKVEAGSPAADAGIHRGDIILAVDDQQVNTMLDLMREVEGKSAGDQIIISVQRCDATEEVTLELAEKNDHLYLGLQTSREPIFDILPFRRGTFSMAVEQPAFVISRVIPESPADDAGLDAGMLILGIAGEGLDEGDDLADIIQAYRPGDEITLEVSEPGQESSQSVDITLGQNPGDPDRAYLGIEYFSVPGVEGDGFPGNRIPRFNMPDDQHGIPEWHAFPSPPEGFEQAVVISSVSEGSPAELAGLQMGDIITAVNGESIHNAADFVDVVQGFDSGDMVTLTVFRAGESEELSVEIELGEHPEEESLAYLGVTVGNLLHMEGDGPFNKFDMPFHFEFDFPWPEGSSPELQGDPLQGDEA